MHEAVSTSSKEAQAYYDQGLALLHSYFWIDAERSFHQALRLDPKLGMAWVRISQVDTSGFLDPFVARAALAQAELLAGGMAPWERTRTALRKLQLDSIDDPKDLSRLQAYRVALDQALASRYGDPELWLLRGNLEEPLGAWGIGQFGTAASIPFYEHVLRLVPDHPAAHHYLIHSFENVGRIDDALEHGEIYARLAPAMPHARHMYAHNLRRVGRTREAIAEFLVTDNLETTYYASEKIAPEFDWHHLHNLDLLAGSYQHEGEMQKAELRLRSTLAFTPVTEALAFNQKQWPAFLLSRGKAKESLDAAEEMTRSKWASARAMGYVLRGQAYLTLGKVDDAGRQVARAEAELKDIGGPRAALLRKAAGNYVDILREELLLRGPGRVEAEAALKKIEGVLRAPQGPDAWSQALFDLENIARTSREAGAWNLAEYTAAQMIEHDAAYAGGHYALGLAAEHLMDPERSHKAFTEAAKLWDSADHDLPERRDALARVSK
jgi:tetratricopeptide (TPR) repeat protein